MSIKKKLSHLDEAGKANMIDVSAKTITARKAKASCKIFMNETAFGLVKENSSKKGPISSISSARKLCKKGFAEKGRALQWFKNEK